MAMMLMAPSPTHRVIQIGGMSPTLPRSPLARVVNAIEPLRHENPPWSLYHDHSMSTI